MIITISREFGSGGRELGKRLADELGIAYYDKEILTALAESTSMDVEYLRKVLRNGVSTNIPLTFSSTLAGASSLTMQSSYIVASQHRIIREIADKGDCIIVGRAADAVLKDRNPFSIFVYADISSRIERCKMRATEEEKMTDREWEKKIKEVDKSRAKNYKFISETAWGDMHSYNMCLDLTNIEVKSIVPSVAVYAKAWFEKNSK